MRPWQRLSTVAQLVAYLTQELERGRWHGRMPGVIRLARELGVARNSVEAALFELERIGVLVPMGAGRGRLIELKRGDRRMSSLRVAILPGEEADRRVDYLVELRHELEKAGHSAAFAPDSIVELGMSVKRIANMVTKTEADAWVVAAGPRDLLDWFATGDLPVFALFGRRRGLPMASVGPDKPSAYATATRALLDLGHRRIVLLARPRRRLPVPGASEQAFLDELAASGITPDLYHLPDWEVTIEGFHGRLESLFKITPPTALIIDEAPFFVAAQQFLAGRGLRVPEDVSLVCTDADPAFAWCKPAVSHIRWDSHPVVKRILRWVANVSTGEKDLRQTLTPAEFVTGGTIGPAKIP